MYRLQRWLRHRRDGGSVNAEPAAANHIGADTKNSDLGAPPHSRPTAAPLAAGYPTWPGGDRPAGSYNVAAGAGVLPGADPAYRGSGLAPQLQAAPTGALTDRGHDRDPDARSGRRRRQAANAAIVTAAAAAAIIPAAAAQHEPQERTSSHSSRHDSSRTFPAGDCLAGQGSADKDAGELGSSKLSGDMEWSSRAARESHCGGGAAAEAAVRGSLTPIPGAAVGDVPEALGIPVIAAVAAASGVELSPAPAALVAPVVPALRSSRAPPPRSVGGMHEVTTPSPITPPPTMTTRALFEPSYQEREVEQRLRKVVFGSFQQRASTSRPDLLAPTLLESYSSCGGLDARRCGGGVSPSSEWPHPQTPAGTAEAAAGWGAGGGTGPPSIGGDGVAPGWPCLAIPAAPHWSFQCAAQPQGGQQYGGAGNGGGVAGGMAALSARDLLLGRTASTTMPYHYAQALHCQAIAAAGPAGGGLPPAARPTLMAAASVPVPPTPPLDGPYVRLAGLQEPRDRASVAQTPGPPLQRVDEAAAATNTTAQTQPEPLRQQLAPGQRAGVGEPTGARSGAVPGRGLVSGSRSGAVPGRGLVSGSECPSEPGSGPGSASDDEAEGSASDGQRSETVSSQTQTVARLLQSAADGVVAKAGEAVRGLPDPAASLPSTFSFHVRPTAVEGTGEEGGAGIVAAVKATSQLATALGDSADAATVASVAAIGSTSGAAAAATAAAAGSPADRLGDTAAVVLEAGSSCAEQAGSRPDCSAGGDGGSQQSTLAAVLACLAGEDLLLQGTAQSAPAAEMQQQRKMQPQQSPPLWLAPQSQATKAWPQPQERGSTASSAPQAPLPGLCTPAHSVLSVGMETPLRQDDSDAAGARVPSAQALAGTLRPGPATTAAAAAARSKGQNPKGGAGVAATSVAVALAGRGSGLAADVALMRRRSEQRMGAGTGPDEVAAERGLAKYVEGQVAAARVPVQAALMAPRVWPASGAAGPEGPLARCVAERLMTRNPLFKQLRGSVTPDGVDSGNEDEGVDEE